MSHQQVPANYQQPETYAMPVQPQTRPFSPQVNETLPANYQAHPVSYQQPGASTMSGIPQAQPLSPPTSQVPSISYQPHPVNYKHSETSIMPDTSQGRPFSPQTSQLPSGQWQQYPANYQQPKNSTMPLQPHTRPFSPQATQIQSTNYKTHPANYRQSENSTMSGTLQAEPFSPPAQMSAASNQASSVDYHQPEISVMPDPPQTKHFAPHIGVKQHVQRFSAPTSQVNNGYPRQQSYQYQQYAAGPRAPAMTSHAGFDVSARRTEDATHEQVRPFSPRDDRLVQSPTDNFIANKDHGPTRTPAVQPDSSAYRESNVNVVSSEQHFSPSGAQVTWAMTSPTHTQQHQSAASVPAAWTHGTETTTRPFSPRAVPSAAVGERQLSGQTPQHGRDGYIVQEKRPFSPSATNKPITPTQVYSKPTENTSMLEHRPVSHKSYEEPRNQATYPTSSMPAVAPVDSNAGYRIDTVPLSSSEDQLGRQQVHSPVTSPTFASGVSSDGQRMDTRPLSPSADQAARQPAYQPVTSPAADGSIGQRTDERPFSPSSVTDINQSITDRALSPTVRPFSPAVSSSSLQRPSSAPSSSASGAADGNIQGYRRICFSPIPQPVRPAQRASPIPLMMSQQPAVPPAAATKESRISVTGARLVFAPRRGSDVTASTPTYLTSGATRTQLNVLRENQVADWKDSRRPVMWTPPASTAGRSRSLEPVSGTARFVHSTSSTVRGILCRGKQRLCCSVTVCSKLQLDICYLG